MKFVSVAQALSSIAGCCQLAEEKLNSVLGISLEMYPLPVSLGQSYSASLKALNYANYVAGFRRLWARSEAAAWLGKALNDAEFRPPSIFWYDGRKTGVLTINPLAAHDFLPALQDLADAFRRALESHERRLLPFHGRAVGANPGPNMWDASEGLHNHAVGFDKDELVQLLDAYGIPHRLQDFSSAGETEDSMREPDHDVRSSQQIAAAMPQPIPPVERKYGEGYAAPLPFSVSGAPAVTSNRSASRRTLIGFLRDKLQEVTDTVPSDLPLEEQRGLIKTLMWAEVQEALKRSPRAIVDLVDTDGDGKKGIFKIRAGDVRMPYTQKAMEAWVMYNLPASLGKPK